MKMQDLNFSTNWNNKLDCKSFTTLRLSDRFKVGDTALVKMRNEIKGTANVIGKKSFLLDQINEYIAELDTGYSAKECKAILKDIYKHKNINWETQLIHFYLLKYQYTNTKSPLDKKP